MQKRALSLSEIVRFLGLRLQFSVLPIFFSAILRFNLERMNVLMQMVTSYYKLTTIMYFSMHCRINLLKTT